MPETISETGASTDATTGPWGVGVFGVRGGQSVDTSGPRALGVALTGIQDGTSNTLMISEGLIANTTGWGGPMGEVSYPLGG